MNLSSLFAPMQFGPLELRNRVVVSPMTRVSATQNGLATEQMAEYYARYGRGGFGLVMTEGTYTDEAYSQAYSHQPGIANNAQAAAWRKLVDIVHDAGVPIFMQLMHAGALVQENRFIDTPIAPSAVTPAGEQLSMYFGSGEFATPQAMDETQIIEAIQGFVAAAKRAYDAGFNGIEIHAADGYLLDQFITARSNQRNDGYGGSIGDRLRMPSRVVGAVRDALSPDFPIGIRLSQTKVNDADYRWDSADDAALIFQSLAQAGASYLHITGVGATEPAFAPDGPSLTELAKHHGGGVPIIANGDLHKPENAAAVLDSQGADFVSLARGALANPDWPRRTQAGMPLHAFDKSLLSPVATLNIQSEWEAAKREGAPNAIFEPLHHS